MRRWFPSLFVAGCLLAGVPAVTWAQTNPGFSFVWGDGGPSGKQQLGYVLDYGTPGHMQDRYRLKIKRQDVAIDSIVISYPDYYDGTFNEDKVSLQMSARNKIFNFKKPEVIPVSSVKVDADSRIIEIIPEAPIPAGTNFEAVLSNVQNPRSGGMYYFNCRVTSPGDLPIMRYVGTWVLSIYRS